MQMQKRVETLFDLEHIPNITFNVDSIRGEVQKVHVSLTTDSQYQKLREFISVIPQGEIILYTCGTEVLWAEFSWVGGFSMTASLILLQTIDTEIKVHNMYQYDSNIPAELARFVSQKWRSGNSPIIAYAEYSPKSTQYKFKWLKTMYLSIIRIEKTGLYVLGEADNVIHIQYGFTPDEIKDLYQNKQAYIGKKLTVYVCGRKLYLYGGFANGEHKSN